MCISNLYPYLNYPSKGNLMICMGEQGQDFSKSHFFGPPIGDILTNCSKLDGGVAMASVAF